MKPSVILYIFKERNTEREGGRVGGERERKESVNLNNRPAIIGLTGYGRWGMIAALSLGWQFSRGLVYWVF
jgi:hypothetical protein